jgi:hypothetical protein
MARSTKPRHAHKPRLIKIPMMKSMRNMIALELHTAFATLSIAPCRDQFDAIGQIFNMIGLAIEKDSRFPVEFRIVQSGTSAMVQISDGFDRTGVLRPTDLELLSVRNAVNVCDEILPRLDITRMHLANVALAAMRGSEKTEAA